MISLSDFIAGAVGLVLVGGFIFFRYLMSTISKMETKIQEERVKDDLAKIKDDVMHSNIDSAIDDLNSRYGDGSEASKGSKE